MSRSGFKPTYPSEKKNAKQRKQLTLVVEVDAEIHLPTGPALKRIRRPLIKALTFENPLWRRKLEKNIPLGSTQKDRRAYQKNDHGLILARGAWRLLRQLAQEHQVVIQWKADTITPEQRPAEFHFTATLRPYQQAAVDALLEAKSGVIVIPTGGGKTVVAMGLANILKTNTLFIVHTRELLHQTRENASSFLGLPLDEIGIIGAGQWQPASFTVALIQTLSRRDLSGIRNKFALIIVDEAHHAPANTYCQVLAQFPARYRVALTATPYRKDRMHHLLWLQFGEIVYQVAKRKLEEFGKLMIPSIFPIPTSFSYPYQEDFSTMITYLCRDPKRQHLIVDTITETHRKNGVSLVLTERVDHARSLFYLLKKENMPVVMITGKVPSQKRQKLMQKLKSGEAELLIATLALVGEGWDFPSLETLYLTVPNGNKTKTTQALGRILRPALDKLKPRVFDFVDGKIGILRYHWGIRARVYGLSSEELRYAMNAKTEVEEYNPFPKPPRPEDLAIVKALSQGNYKKASELVSARAKKPSPIINILTAKDGEK